MISSSVEQSPTAPEARPLATPMLLNRPFLSLLYGRRSWLAKVAVIALLMSTIVAFTVPKEYESTARLMSPDLQPASGMALLGMMTGAALPPNTAGLASSFLSGKSSGSTLIGILQSRTLQDDLIDHFDLRRVYHMKYYKDARKKLAKRTDIDEDRKTGIISITVKDNDPYRARDLARAYVEDLDKLVVQMSTSSARRERVFLEDRLKTVKQELDFSSHELSQFSSSNATFDVENQGKTMIEAAAKLQGELIAAESELRGLETIYTANNVRVRAARARIAELQQQLRQAGGTDDDVSGANHRGDQLYPPLRKLPLLGVAYRDLYRQVKIQETVYEVLTRQYELAKVEEAKEIPTVKVLDAPVIPEKQSFPPRLLIITMSTFLAFAFAVTWLHCESAWGFASYHAMAALVGDSLATMFISPFVHIKRRQTVAVQPSVCGDCGASGVYTDHMGKAADGALAVRPNDARVARAL